MRAGRKVNEIMEETEIEEEERKGKTRKEDENTGKKAGG